MSILLIVVDSTVDYLVDNIIDSLVDCIVGYRFDCLIECLIDCLVDYLVDFLIDYLVDCVMWWRTRKKLSSAFGQENSKTREGENETTLKWDNAKMRQHKKQTTG